MFDTIMGLPVHILVIHAVVVLGPLSAILAIWYAARPTRRERLRWPLVAGAVATGVMGFVAGESGEALERRVKAADAGDAGALALVHDHAEAGDVAKMLCLLFLVVVLVSVFVLLPSTGSGRGRSLGMVGAVALVAASLAMATSVTITGHSGAKAAWADQVSGPAPTGGEGGGN